MSVFENGKMYFATSYREDDLNVIRQTRPDHILASFAMWRTKLQDKDLFKDFIKKIGYVPKSTVIDSGAFTFRSDDYGIEEIIETYQEMREEDGHTFDIDNDLDFALFVHWCFGEFEEDFYVEDKSSFCLFQQYLNFLFWNDKHYNFCFAFDRVGDNEESKLSYRIMNQLGLAVVPVYQAARVSERRGKKEVVELKDWSYLDYYVEMTDSTMLGSLKDYIAIGGTAMSKIKGYTKEKRVEIIRNVIDRYPNKKFHLLGTLDPYIVERCPELYSFDGQCWLEKKPKEIKIPTAISHINKKTHWFGFRKWEAAHQLSDKTEGLIELLS